MREAIKNFEGSHDVRNFCKLDPSKQVENVQRGIFFADVGELDPQKGPVGYVGLPGFRHLSKHNGIPMFIRHYTYLPQKASGHRNGSLLS